MYLTNWIDFQGYFNVSEFTCPFSGDCRMDKEFMYLLLALRKAYARPMKILSGYRDISHTREDVKYPSLHTKGLAVDIACHPMEAYTLIDLALEFGFTGIGVAQAFNTTRHVHLDLRSTIPVIFSC